MLPPARRSVLALAAAPLLRARQNSRPNFVILYADDLGYGDLSSYGNREIATPSIDSIGRRGVRFSRFYANAPECTPSRTALLTGRYQQRVGGLECAIGLGNVGRYDEAEWLQQRGELGLPASEATLPRALKSAGYDTAIFGKWHLGYDEKFRPRHHGFDESFCVLGGGVDYFRHSEPGGLETLIHNDRHVTAKGYFTDLIVDRAIEWVAKRRDRPFFLYLPFTTPHAPYQGPDDSPFPVDQPWANTGPRATYRRMIERMDQRAGELLAVLAKRSDAADTAIVFLSDNGAPRMGSNAPFRGGKGQLFEGGIRVPCMMQWPSRLKSGVETAAPAMNLDLTATFAAAAGVPLQSDGIDLMPLLKGGGPPPRRALFFRYKRLANRRRAVMQGGLKYIIDNGEEHIYDLDADPAESRNLLAERPRDAQRMRQDLAAWEREVAAPRLRGFSPA